MREGIRGRMGAIRRVKALVGVLLLPMLDPFARHWPTSSS